MVPEVTDIYFTFPYPYAIIEKTKVHNKNEVAIIEILITFEKIRMVPLAIFVLVVPARNKMMTRNENMYSLVIFKTLVKQGEFGFFLVSDILLEHWTVFM